MRYTTVYRLVRARVGWRTDEAIQIILGHNCASLVRRICCRVSARPTDDRIHRARNANFTGKFSSPGLPLLWARAF
jgi:hypothetical protein